MALNEAEANVTTLRARLAEYEARYAQLKATAESLPKIDTEWTQLNRDYDIQKRQYESLVSRRETASLTGKLEDAGVAEFRIIDPPRVTPDSGRAESAAAALGSRRRRRSRPDSRRAFVVSQVRPTFHDGRVLREIAGRPVLGMVSMIASPEFRHASGVARRLLFAGGMGGLVASYAVAFAIIATWPRAASEDRPMSIIEKAAQRLEQLRQAGVEVPPRCQPPTRRRARDGRATGGGASATPEHAPRRLGNRRRGSRRCAAAPAGAVRRNRGEPAGPGRRSKLVEIDLGALAAAGYVTPEAPRSQIADEFRVIKRPIIKNAQGEIGSDGRAWQLRHGDERAPERGQELHGAQSGDEHRDGARQHGAPGRCRRRQSESHEANASARGTRGCSTS